MNLGNLWVVESIRHLGADGLADLLQQCAGATIESTFGSKPSGENCRERHYHKPWFDVDCHIAKCELNLWLKANPNLHTTKHQKSKLKSLLKRKLFFWGNYKNSTYVCTCQGGCVFVLEKVSAKGTYYGKNQCNYAFGRLPWISWPISATHTASN